MVEIALKPSLILLLASIIAYAIYAILIRKNKSTIPDLPWVNKKKNEWFSTARARLRCSINYKDAIQDAYENVSCIVGSPVENEADRLCSIPRKSAPV